MVSSKYVVDCTLYVSGVNLRECIQKRKKEKKVLIKSLIAPRIEIEKNVRKNH